jgi:hypothetical protein
MGKGRDLSAVAAEFFVVICQPGEHPAGSLARRLPVAAVAGLEWDRGI